MRMRGDVFEALAADLDAAVTGIWSLVARHPELWTHGRPGRWTVGDHVAHVGITLKRTADEFEMAERALRAGTLAPVPAKRGPLARLFLAIVGGRGYMPRGLKTAPWAVPPEGIERRAALETLRQGAAHHRDLGMRLDPGERDRLWIVNPFRTGWHYRLPEMVRVHAVHARHHSKLIAELVGARLAPRSRPVSPAVVSSRAPAARGAPGSAPSGSRRRRRGTRR